MQAYKVVTTSTHIHKVLEIFVYGFQCRFATLKVSHYHFSNMDLFSKMAHVLPHPGLPAAKEDAQLLVQHILCLHGLHVGNILER